MSWQLRTTLVTIGLALMSFAHVSDARAQQKVLTNEQSQIVFAVNTMFTALRTDDAVKFNSVIAPDFYMFDGGRRLNGEAVAAFIRALHVAGKRYEWSVTEPDVHISGNIAWIAYINEGTITDPSGRINQRWLESAFLEKQAGVWKILFMHSTRAPTPQENRNAKIISWPLAAAPRASRYAAGVFTADLGEAQFTLCAFSFRDACSAATPARAMIQGTRAGGCEGEGS